MRDGVHVRREVAYAGVDVAEGVAGASELVEEGGEFGTGASEDFEAGVGLVGGVAGFCNSLGDCRELLGDGHALQVFHVETEHGEGVRVGLDAPGAFGDCRLHPVDGLADRLRADSVVLEGLAQEDEFADRNAGLVLKVVEFRAEFDDAPDALGGDDAGERGDCAGHHSDGGDGRLDCRTESADGGLHSCHRALELGGVGSDLVVDSCSACHWGSFSSCSTCRRWTVACAGCRWSCRAGLR